MADLGAIGVSRSRRYARSLNTWHQFYTNATLPKVNRTPRAVVSVAYWEPGGTTRVNALTQTLTGTVRLTPAGPVVPFAEVRLMWRKTGLLIARTQADAAGVYQFSVNPHDLNAYQVVALDPDGGDSYNDVILAGL